MRRQQQANGEERTSARWQRRAARQEAERRRVPKHGKGYVDLAQRIGEIIYSRAEDGGAPES